jgi:hypothetical protein
MFDMNILDLSSQTSAFITSESKFTIIWSAYPFKTSSLREIVEWY